jgi:hypothetical protein
MTIKPGDDIRRAGPAPPYGAPAFRFEHEVRPRAESSAEAYRRAYPQFFKVPTRRQARRRAIRGG